MSNKCNMVNCERDRFQGNEQCVLHCNKNDYLQDFSNVNILKSFYEELIDYIALSIFDEFQNEASIGFTVSSIKEVIHNRTSVNKAEVGIYLKRKIMIFSSIFFPDRDSRDNFDYCQVLKQVKGVYFNSCSFFSASISIPNVEVFYQDCHFLKYWSIGSSKVLQNESDVVYQNCTFQEHASIVSSNDATRLVEQSLFNGCSFEKKLSLEGVQFKQAVFNNTGNERTKIHELRIHNCIFEDKFIVNKIETDYIYIKSSEFKSKFEIKESHINEACITNTNFYGLFDSFKTEYGKFYCYKSIFNDFVGFERCKFAVEELKGDYEVAKFVYATFLSFTNFRNTEFHSGLDLENTNLKEAPNFLNIELRTNSTNRETLRIIKNSFDKIGNKIEANKFFIKEMIQYEQSFDEKPMSQEKAVLKLNKLVSNFGQSYIRPVVWIFGFAFIYCMIVLGYENNYLYKIIPEANDVIRCVTNFINNIFSSILPFKKLLREGMEFISLAFHIIFAGLIWQTIVAIKRHTRR